MSRNRHKHTRLLKFYSLVTGKIKEKERKEREEEREEKKTTILFCKKLK